MLHHSHQYNTPTLPDIPGNRHPGHNHNPPNRGPCSRQLLHGMHTVLVAASAIPVSDYENSERDGMAVAAAAAKRTCLDLLDLVM